MSDHDVEFEEMVIGRALDALEPDDVKASASSDDPAMVTAVREYQEVLSHLHFDEVEPRAELEDRVFAAAMAARPATVPSISRRRRYVRVGVLAGAATVAASVALVLIAGHNPASNNTPRVQIVSNVDPAIVAQLLSTKGAQKFDLVGEAGIVGRVVVAQGQGALYGTTLPVDPRTDYWFWVTGNDATIPVGIVSAPHGGLLFAKRGDVTGALITAEPAGVAPAKPGRVVGEGQLTP